MLRLDEPHVLPRRRDVEGAGKKLDFEGAVDREVSTLQFDLGAVSERQLQTDTTRADERGQDCEVLFHVNRQCPSIACARR